MFSSNKINFFVNCLMLLLCTGQILTRPNKNDEYGQQSLGSCEYDDKTMVVCQRCAKQTKSNIVFPMCCRNEDDALNWCDTYIHYGDREPLGH